MFANGLEKVVLPELESKEFRNRGRCKYGIRLFPKSLDMNTLRRAPLKRKDPPRSPFDQKVSIGINGGVTAGEGYYVCHVFSPKRKRRLQGSSPPSAGAALSG